MTTANIDQKPLKKKRKTYNFKNFVIHILRKGSYKHPERNAALKEARFARNQYKCAHCAEGRYHPRKGVQIDHVEPAVPLTGWVSFDSFINRLYCSKEGFQILCIKHHEIKTKKEKELRKQYKAFQKAEAERSGE